MSDDQGYEITIDMNVLNHLGMNLYSNTPAVLSEVVANSWDADATTVDITFDNESVTIKDNGCGMTKDEINKKYLTVGFRRRDHGEAQTPSGRPVMGRKGIGKLSLFSTANKLEVTSYKNGEKSGCILDAEKIKEAIEAKAMKKYFPPAILPSAIDLTDNGTKIVITEFRREFSRSPAFLKTRIARRFGIIGDAYNFNVKINGNAISISDRDYFHKLQFLWWYGLDSEGEKYIQECEKRGNKLEFEDGATPSILIDEQAYSVRGWLGTVRKPSELKDVENEDNLNKITIMVRGKLAQEDILEEFTEGGIYSDYLMGEIYADFLDLNEKEDIATSNRQEIFKQDPRYLKLKEWVHSETKKIQGRWSELRNESGVKDALQIEPIKRWWEKLSRDQQKYAKQLFGKIHNLKTDNESVKRQLYKNGIIAFETLKVRENLQKLEEVSPENFEEFIKIFDIQDDLEAALYYQMIEGRIAIIKKFEGLVEEDVIERTLQEYIYNHLWLLDTSWERGTENPRFEEQIATEFQKITANLSDEEKAGRVDIRYKQVTGEHVIVELKRASASINSHELAGQVTKYKNALIKFLKAQNETDINIEIICLIGKKCSDWITDDEERKSRAALKIQDIRIVYHKELISNAMDSYKKYLQKKAEVGEIQKLLAEIDAI